MSNIELKKITHWKFILLQFQNFNWGTIVIKNYDKEFLNNH